MPLGHISNNAALGEVFLPGQIFGFSGFALWANSLGHLEDIDSYAPGHQTSFGNLDYVADIRGDLIFQGFTTPTSTLALDPECITGSEDGIPGPAGLSMATKPSTGEPEEVVLPATITKPDPSPDTGSEPSESAPCELGQGVSFPPYPMGSLLPGQTSPLSKALDLMRSLVITEGQCPNYAQPGLGAESGEFYVPPTTHFIATFEDLTNMLDYISEDIGGMDDDAGEGQAQNPPFTGR